MERQKPDFLLILLLHRDIPENQQHMLLVIDPYIIGINEKDEAFILQQELCFVLADFLLLPN
ncbi:hypothetical protein D3C73_1470530 [compost metagenome]